MDDAVYGSWHELNWQPLYYPTGLTMDLAFVVTDGLTGEPCIEIDKWVWDEYNNDWVEKISAKVCTNVEFKIEVRNCGDTDLTDILIIDELPDCLGYVIYSANPKEPTVVGNKLKWSFFGPLTSGGTITITFKAHVVSEGENVNEVDVTAESDGRIVTAGDTTRVVGLSPVPDIACEGSLFWNRVRPGGFVIGSFNITNVGDPGLNLFWKIDSYPAFGTWTFSSTNGGDLKPEDGALSVTVSVVAPNQKNKDFSWKIKIVNQENSSDYCTVSVSLSTPKAKIFNQDLIYRFLLIARLLRISNLYRLIELFLT